MRSRRSRSTDFVIADGLHMNDWGYACFAQLLGDDIIKSVGQIKLGVNVPAAVQTYRPMWRRAA